ncbi:hypothetical protein, partial [Paraburkholderia sp. NMBU_R16]|uniref:hypothetical protein n=1 Tax=Paraburkholderia sp. NMBU_R16 TaxID=2698676 RepID=UPI001C2552AA
RFSTLPAPVGNVERAFFVFAIIDVLRFNSHRFYSSSLMRQSPVSYNGKQFEVWRDNLDERRATNKMRMSRRG